MAAFYCHCFEPHSFVDSIFELWSDSSLAKEGMSLCSLHSSLPRDCDYQASLESCWRKRQGTEWVKVNRKHRCTECTLCIECASHQQTKWLHSRQRQAIRCGNPLFLISVAQCLHAVYSVRMQMWRFACDSLVTWNARILRLALNRLLEVLLKRFPNTSHMLFAVVIVFLLLRARLFADVSFSKNSTNFRIHQLGAMAL